MTQKEWLGPYAPTDRHADKITIDEIISLRKKLAEAERQRDNALQVLGGVRSYIGDKLFTDALRTINNAEKIEGNS